MGVEVSKYKRKYRKGNRIKTLALLLRVLDRGDYCYLRDKPTHPAWVRAMPLSQLMLAVAAGSFQYAVRRQYPLTPYQLRKRAEAIKRIMEDWGQLAKEVCSTPFPLLRVMNPGEEYPPGKYWEFTFHKEQV